MSKLLLSVFALLCAAVQGAWAESVTFQVRSWDEENEEVVTTTETQDCTVLEGDHGDDWIGLDGYYVVKSDTKYKVLNIMGDTHLILSNGATLSCAHVKLEGDHKLSIYSVSDSNTGTLRVYNTTDLDSPRYGVYSDAAAIGSGGKENNMGSFYVHGATIDVIQAGQGAGIGGGYESSIGGEVIVYAGEMKITNYNNDFAGAGIGGGLRGNQGGPITIYGGKVNAQSRGGAAAIGGGKKGNGGLITIWGGTVDVIGGHNGAGIGAGYEGTCGSVYIYGGEVYSHVRGFDKKSYGTAIGGGRDGKGGNVHILGGKVELFGGTESRAIGGYDSSDHGTLEIGDGMRVTAGSLSISDNTNYSPNPERVFTNGERPYACWYRSYAKIETCDHTTPTEGSDQTEAQNYTFTQNYHTWHCRYCNLTDGPKNHFYDNGATTCVCGFEQDSPAESVTVNFWYQDGNCDINSRTGIPGMTKGQKFVLPEPTTNRSDMLFMGYIANPTTRPTSIEMQADEEEHLLRAGEVVTLNETREDPFTHNQIADYFARFLYVFEPEWTWADDYSSVSLTLRNANFNDITLSSTGDNPQVNITSTKLNIPIHVIDLENNTNEDNTLSITFYSANCSYRVGTYVYTFNDDQTVSGITTTADITLGDNTDNSETIADNEQCPVNVTLSGRTLWKDGSWNTLCLPFDVEDISETPLDGATLMTFTSAEYDEEEGTLALYFDEASSIKAGTPYIVKWTTTGDPITDPVFNGCTISTTAGGAVGTQWVDFEGSFSPVTLDANEKTMLYLGGDNSLYYPTANMTVGSCRALFRLHNGLKAGAPTLSEGNTSLRFVLNFSDENASAIDCVQWSTENGQWSTVNGQSSMVNGQWFTLDGRKLNGMPSQRGIYIVGGKKVVMK